jgi:hypothetical protein
MYCIQAFFSLWVISIGSNILGLYVYLSRGSTDEINSVPGLSTYVIWYYIVQEPSTKAFNCSYFSNLGDWLILTAAKITLVLAGPSCYKFVFLPPLLLNSICYFRAALSSTLSSVNQFNFFWIWIWLLRRFPYAHFGLGFLFRGYTTIAV